MYKSVEKYVVKEFIKSNSILFRFIFIIIIFIQPVILVFGPLPAYLYYTANLSSPVFIFSLLFLIVCSYISSVGYQSIVDKRYFDWVILSIGQSKFIMHYVFGQAKFAIFTWVFLLLGLIKVENYLEAFYRMLLIFFLHLVYYICCANKIIKRTRRFSPKNPYIHLIMIFLSPVVFHFIAYTLLCLAYISLLLISNQIIRVTYAGFLMLFIFMVGFIIIRIIKSQIKNHEYFLKSVSSNLYSKVIYIFYVFNTLMIMMPLIVFILVTL